MLCLTCGEDNLNSGPECQACGGWIGYVADHRGFLPQLEALEEGLAAGVVEPSEARDQLTRLEQALQVLINELDEQGQNLVALDFDESQQGTLGGFLAPVRDGLDRMLVAVAELDVMGNWSETLWEDLREAQLQVMRGNEGMEFLARAVAEFQHAGNTGSQS